MRFLTVNARCFLALLLMLPIGLFTADLARAGEMYIAVNMLSGPLHSENAIASMQHVSVQVENPNGAVTTLRCESFVSGQSVACGTTLEGSMAISGTYRVRTRFDLEVMPEKKSVPEKSDKALIPPDMSQGVPYVIRVLFTDRRNAEIYVNGRVQPSRRYRLMHRFINK